RFSTSTRPRTSSWSNAARAPASPGSRTRCSTTTRPACCTGTVRKWPISWSKSSRNCDCKAAFGRLFFASDATLMRLAPAADTLPAHRSRPCRTECRPMQKDPLELWNFAVALYEEEDVKAACLRVQARYGLSISLLLGAIWIGINGFGRFGATDMEMVIRRAMEWHREVIEPIRALRRQLRREPPQGVEEQTHALRHQLVEAELEAERIEMR